MSVTLATKTIDLSQYQKPEIKESLYQRFCDQCCTLLVVRELLRFGVYQADKESMRSLGSSPAYEVTFTLINPQPDVVSVMWDVQSAVDSRYQSFHHPLVSICAVVIIIIIVIIRDPPIMHNFFFSKLCTKILQIKHSALSDYVSLS